MGEMCVTETAHQDKTTSDTTWVSVTFEPVDSFIQPLPLLLIKQTTGLENLALLKQPPISSKSSVGRGISDY